MRNLIALLLLCTVNLPAFACDEACKRDKAEAQYQVKFPSYLSAKYCEGLASDFMNNEIKSLQKYRDTQLLSMHRGGMNNISKFISQRQEWLHECDDYLVKTHGVRLFNNDETTDKIFEQMNNLNQELVSLIKGVTYGADEDDSKVAADKFDQFFQLVSEHQTLMQIKGRMVYR